jgi:hypothetical protein
VRHQIKGLASMIVLLLLSGCALLGRCDYESRTVVAEGRFTEGATEVATAEITVGANRGGLEWRDFHWVITGPSLEGHVTSLALVTAAAPHTVLLDLPLNYQPEGYISISALIQYKGESSPALGGIFEVVAANGAAIEIRTDLPSRPLVRIPLSSIHESDWYRPHTCS